MKRILSIQGGGIRGIIPCCALIELEKQTGKLTQEVFDFVGGTSTGAALAAAIVAGVPAAVALTVYTQQGPKIFSPQNSFLRYSNLALNGHQFDNKVLNQVIAKTLGAKAGMTLNDSPIGVMITVTAQNGHTWYFVKDAVTNARTTGMATVVDVATASCCATTYHAPWQIPGFGYFADGGCSSLADPIYQTLVESLLGYKCYGSIIPSEAIAISLGTGFYDPLQMPSPPSGILDEISWVTGSLVDSSETMALEAAQRQWPDLVQVFDPPLSTGIDEADVDKIPLLLQVGQAAASKINWKQALKL